MLQGSARPASAPPPQRLPEHLDPVSDLRIPLSPAQQNSRDLVRVTQATARASSQAVPPASVQTSGPPDRSNQPVEPPALRLQNLYRQAAEHYARIDSYIVRLRRREQVAGKDKPEELLLFKFRKEPWSVYFKWLGKEGKGREVVYVKDHYENKIHTLLAAGDVPLLPAGKQFAIAPDNPLVRSSSRYSIQQAGIGVLIDRFGRLASAAGNMPATLRYLGFVTRPEFPAPCEAVEQTILAGVDPLLPRGGQRLWVFDPGTKFPTLIIAHDETGHEVEYYCYDRFQFPVKLDDDDFNPETLWKPRKGS